MDGPVDPNATKSDRGRLTPLDAVRLREDINSQLSSIIGTRSHLRKQREYMSDGSYELELTRRRLRREMTVLEILLHDEELHEDSYDMVTRPSFQFSPQGRVDPFTEWSEAEFLTHTRFNKEQLRRVVASLTLLPDTIVTPWGCACSLEMAIFIVLIRYTTASTWDKLQHDLNRGRCALIQIFTTTRDLLASSYYLLLTQFDYLRLQPIVNKWVTEMEERGLAHADVIGFIDGKAWKTTRPGMGKFNKEVALLAGTELTNIQRWVACKLVPRVPRCTHTSLRSGPFTTAITSSMERK